jgi:hypothetical protein
MSMIISTTDFLYNGTLYFKDSRTGRCYRFAEPASDHSEAARKNLLVKKRVSEAVYRERLEACKRNIAGGAA